MIDERKQLPSTEDGTEQEPNETEANSPTDTGSLPATEAETLPADAEPTGVHERPDGREIVVPLALYKTITVFSTLAAIVTFFLGFLLLDAATLQASILRELIAFGLGVVGISLVESNLTSLLAIAGLTSIATGSGVYILGTRFRAQGMGKAQDDSTGRDVDG